MPSHNSNHEYHLAQADEVNSKKPPKILISRQRVKTRVLFICAIFGVIASFFIIGICIRPFLSQSLNNQSGYENVTARLFSSNSAIMTSSFASTTSVNISAVDESVDEEEAVKKQYDKILEDSLRPSQKDAIDKLRLEVEDNLTSSYMRTANYLIRWLRAKNWDLEDAKEMLLDHMEFRAEYEMDSVFETNFTFFEKEYPVFEDGVDYHGGPVISVNVEDWDIRRLTMGGYEKEFFRYYFRMFERGIKLAENYHAKGTNITQGMLILNFKNYSVSKHGCFPCLPILIRMLFGMDDNYPGWLHHIIVINGTEIVNALAEILLPYLSGENRAALQVFGLNKAEWQQKILSLAAADQIRPEFGGTKVDSDNSNEL